MHMKTGGKLKALVNLLTKPVGHNTTGRSTGDGIYVKIQRRRLHVLILVIAFIITDINRAKVKSEYAV